MERFYFAIKHESGGWYDYASKFGPHDVRNAPKCFPDQQKARSAAEMLCAAGRGKYYAVILDPEVM